MCKEDYCSYEQSKKLKELGFDWACNHYYGLDESLHEETQSYLTNYGHINDNPYLISAPTLAQAQKWLREVRDIILCVGFDGEVYYWYIITDDNTIVGNDFNTYEEAFLEAIDKSLELIQEQKDE